jgi:hypothetical protein
MLKTRIQRIERAGRQVVFQSDLPCRCGYLYHMADGHETIGMAVMIMDPADGARMEMDYNKA